MARQEVLPPSNIDEIISRIEGEQGIRYAPQQRQAVELAAQRQVMLLTGGPGTGKTTSLRGILGLFNALGVKTDLAAPTGRAAKRLSDLCGVDATTIHRLLEAGYDQGSNQLAFSKNEDEPLTCDAVIVDEMSMVDIPLMASLLRALKGDCRLVLVGDPDQLPSVGPGQLFDHLIRSGRLPMVRLTEIFRQAQESAIVMNAHAVDEGRFPDLSNRSRDFFFLRRTDPEQALETIVDLCVRRLPQNMGIPADQIQVLSPSRKYTTGTASLNRALQAALNPPSPEKKEKKYGSWVFREGDRVMQIRNNYDIMWREDTGLKGGMGIFNGDVGIIQSITPHGDLLTINFEGRIADYTPDMLPELEPAYAMTVHKAQGSEYRAVILSAVNGPPMLLTRGVLYTAITRAKDLLIIVGDESVLAKMVSNDRQARRYSGLRSRLLEETASAPADA
jgi:exodeoxyribonuclease V alpha subunit